jgi:rhodanese-related sulfurtransferase
MASNRTRMGIVLLVLLGAFSAGCNSRELPRTQAASVQPTPLAPRPNDGVRRITPQETQDLLTKNQAVVIDVRSEPAYKAGHIKGSRLLPVNQFLAHVDELPKDKLIVTYCSCPTEHTSAAAVINLKTKGLTNAAALLGGYDAWKNAGLPIETAEGK